MAKSQTISKSKPSRATSQVESAEGIASANESRGEPLKVPGVRLCVPKRQTRQQVLDACEEEIRELAYAKWEAAGCPSGDGFDFWLEAENQVLVARMG